MEINDQLKCLRMKKGMTQKQVADAIEVDKTSYAHYESGRRTPNGKKWVALSKVLGFPVFPAQIQIVYPEGLLDRFEKCINDNEQTPEDINSNNQQFMNISNCLDEVFKVNEEAMNTDDLPIDELIKSPTSLPFTVMNVNLDARAERLTERAIKCMKNLINANQNLY